MGTVHEEVGGYFPRLIANLERSPFLKLVMPWGRMSAVKMATPKESNDGPILWVRPGEQLIPTALLSSGGSGSNSGSCKRAKNELMSLYRRTNEPREFMFEDRLVCLYVLVFYENKFHNSILISEPNVMLIMLVKGLIVKPQLLLGC